MADWKLHGTHRKEDFEYGLFPEHMWDELRRYQEVFGDEFRIDQLLKIKDIEAKAFIAESICDAPEFFMDLLGVSRQYPEFNSISDALRELNEIASEYLEGKK